jgi:peptide/nickel transport system permease protein
MDSGAVLPRLAKWFDQPAVQNGMVLCGIAMLGAVAWWGRGNEQWRIAFRRFRRDRVGIVAAVIISAYLLIGALEIIQVPAGPDSWRSVLAALTSGIPQERSYSAPFAKIQLAKDAEVAAAEASGDPAKLKSASRYRISGTHLLGTTALGKDTLVETLRACKTALLLGGITSVIYIVLGTLLGLMAGYFRRWVDDVIQYVYSTLASIPPILLLVSMLLVLGKGMLSMALALGVTMWVDLCRLIRGETMRQAERTYVAAARALGQSTWKILTRHLLPNVMHLVLIKFVLGFSGIVLAEAVLSYLGVGSPIGTPSWGAMIDGARNELSREPTVWWNLAAATTALFGLVLSLNLFGDALRRAFDPKRN